jgi:hypothetical protein
MRQMIHADISESSFDEFIAFLFARDVPSEREKRSCRWYFNTRATFNLPHVGSYYAQLFRQPCFLLESFTEDQLEQGFSAMQVRSLSCSVRNLIWNADLSLASREECVRSMFYLFRDLLANYPLGYTACMWWDSFCFDWECGNRRRSRGGVDLWMQDVLFETIVEVLELDSLSCQGAALHGLEHLHHPQTEEAVQNFLAQHPSLEEECRTYALSITRFEPLWTRRPKQ